MSVSTAERNTNSVLGPDQSLNAVNLNPEIEQMARQISAAEVGGLIMHVTTDSTPPAQLDIKAFSSETTLAG